MEGGSTALVDMLAYYIGVVDETGKAPAENELYLPNHNEFKTPVLSISDYLSEEDKDSTEGEVKVYGKVQKYQLIFRRIKKVL